MNNMPSECTTNKFAFICDLIYFIHVCFSSFLKPYDVTLLRSIDDGRVESVVQNICSFALELFDYNMFMLAFDALDMMFVIIL